METTDFSKLRVLVLDAFGRQVMPILHGLHRLKCSITTLNYSKLDLGYASRYPKKKILCKNVNPLSEQNEAIIEREIKTKNYDIVIPLSDVSTKFLSSRWNEFCEYIKAPIPNIDTFLIAFDKQRTMEVCMENSIPCTLTKCLNEEIDHFLKRVEFPIVVKPKSGFGSIGFRILKAKEDLDNFLDKVKNDMTNYLIQEYVPQTGKQYNVHAFVDDNNELSFAVPTQKCRWFPIDGGSSCFARTVDRADLIEQCEKLLKIINWRGCCEIELIEDPRNGQIKVMEINGRTSACIKMCQLAGINVAKSMVQFSLGLPVQKQPFIFKDVRMRYLHTDILWFLKSKNRWRCKPGWFNNWHTHDQIFAIGDPIPFFAYSLQSVFRYKKEMKKRKRQ